MARETPGYKVRQWPRERQRQAHCLGRAEQHPGMEYIQPGKPQQNAYIERFNRTVRYEWLSQYYWEDLEEVRLFATNWMFEYNHNRPNMALGGFTPKQRLAMAA